MRYISIDLRPSRLLLCTVLLLGAVLWAPHPSAAQFDAGPAGTRAEEGEPVPSFQITGLRDSSRTYGPSDFEGRYLLLNLWATWCAPCIEKIPALKQIRSRYDEETLAILNVSFDKPKSAAKEFLDERNMPGRHAHAGGRPALADSFGNSFATVRVENRSLRGLPNVTLVAPDGEVLARLGPRSEGLRDALSQHLPSGSTE